MKLSIIAYQLWTPQWEAAWQQQQQLAVTYKKAILPSGIEITSTEYNKHQSRNASRVIVCQETAGGQQRLAAAEVVCLIKLRQPPHTAATAAGSTHGPSAVAANSSSSSVNAANQASQLEVARMAMVKCFNTREPRDEADVAELLLEDRQGDFEARVRAFPLREILCACHTCAKATGWLNFVPVVGRSKRAAFR